MTRSVWYKKIFKVAGPTILTVSLVLSLSLSAQTGGEYELLSGGVGIASESSGGEYTQIGSVVLTVVDANEISGGDYTVVEESPAQVDCVVGMEHFARLATHWLAADCNETNDWCNGADLDYFGGVDYYDLALLAEEWVLYCPHDWPLR